MSLKKMAVKMAIAFAAAKGYEAFRKQGGMKGLQGKLGQMQGGQASGGLGRAPPPLREQVWHDRHDPWEEP
jgi:hypothetical protein